MNNRLSDVLLSVQTERNKKKEKRGKKHVVLGLHPGLDCIVTIQANFTNWNADWVKVQHRREETSDWQIAINKTAVDTAVQAAECEFHLKTVSLPMTRNVSGGSSNGKYLLSKSCHC